jgi:hypothetical protein
MVNVFALIVAGSIGSLNVTRAVALAETLVDPLGG